MKYWDPEFLIDYNKIENSNLIAPDNTTNFIFAIKGKKLSALQLKEINSINDAPQISNRIKKIIELGCKLVLSDIESQNLKLNLQLIDSDLPAILAYLLLIKYSGSNSRLSELIKEINKQNLLNYDLSHGHPFYEYKIKNFLTDSALGMTPAVMWKGHYDATGGIIIVREDGELVCYHIYNRNEFQNYLVNNTKLEQASMGRYGFGNVYEENGKYFLKLNLQIRFW